MAYVDGFVLAVPDKNKEAYRKMAAKFADMFREIGALQIMECWGDDVPDGKETSFPMAVKAGPGETVVFSWVIWPSKAVRDKAHKMMQEDDRMKMPDDMPFDGQRLIYGGFEILVEA